MKIDIDRLTEAELVDLNHRIVARLRFLQQMRAHSEMLEFKIGDRVVFQPPRQGPVEGMLTRYNKKTVTVITDDGRLESNGNFHGAPLGYVLDFLAIVAADVASISERRTDRFLAPEIEAAAAFVADGSAVRAAESVTGPLA